MIYPFPTPSFSYQEVEAYQHTESTAYFHSVSYQVG
jgi:hypothetical protein